MGLFKNDVGNKIVSIKGKLFIKLSKSFFEAIGNDNFCNVA